MSGRPAIFIDRDGTLNEPTGFVNHSSMFRLFPWSVEAVRLINRSGFLAVLVTNQSGLARGLFNKELLHRVHDQLGEMLSEAGARLDAVYYCPHGVSGDCDCRKPKPGMLVRAAEEHEIDLSRSYVVGDTYSDLRMAWDAGGQAALVMTGYGRGYYEHHRDSWSRQPEIVAPDLFSAVAEIVWREGE